MTLVSLNPSTEEVFGEFPELSSQELARKLDLSEQAFASWKKNTFEERGKYMLSLADLFRKNAREYGKIMTLEMGKPIKAAIGEVEKCALACEFYAENAEKFLAKEIIEGEDLEDYVQFDPLGNILAVMPWNFPFWQVVRAAAPILMAGNVMILKHASNVPQSGMMLEKAFLEAGFPHGVFQYLAIGSAKVEEIIRDPRIKAATLTGSTKAGSQVALKSGELIKKTVLELGGSDPFIVLDDANVAEAAKIGVIARFQNNGQSCIAAKRFIVVEGVFDEFLAAFKGELARLKMGDPMDESTDIGPIAARSFMEELDRQVRDSVALGAIVEAGGKIIEGKGFFYEPTVLSNVKKGMPVYDDETFGPIAAIIKVGDVQEAFKVANDTPFGLGASIWTRNIEMGKKYATEIEAGAVFINKMVKSDPRLPFGGVKQSGYGRELAGYGMKEFVNIKSVAVNNP